MRFIKHEHCTGMEQTSCFAFVESEEYTYNAGDQQEEPNEVKLAHMLAECHAVMGVELKEKEQEDNRSSASGS